MQIPIVLRSPLNNSKFFSFSQFQSFIIETTKTDDHGRNDEWRKKEKAKLTVDNPKDEIRQALRLEESRVLKSTIPNRTELKTILIKF